MSRIKQRIERAQTDGSFKALDGLLSSPGILVSPTSLVPDISRVWIQGDGPVNHLNSPIKIAEHVSPTPSHYGQRFCVIRINAQCQKGEPRRFCNLALRISSPSLSDLREMASC